MYLSSLSFSSLRLRPPLEVSLLAGEPEPEPELLELLELDLDLDLLLCWPLLQVCCSETRCCSMRLPLLWCRSKVEVAELDTEFLPDMEPTVVLSVGRLIFSSGFMFLSLLSLSRFTIFSVSRLRSV